MKAQDLDVVISLIKMKETLSNLTLCETITLSSGTNNFKIYSPHKKDVKQSSFYEEQDGKLLENIKQALNSYRDAIYFELERLGVKS